MQCARQMCAASNAERWDTCPRIAEGRDRQAASNAATKDTSQTIVSTQHTLASISNASPHDLTLMSLGEDAWSPRSRHVLVAARIGNALTNSDDRRLVDSLSEDDLARGIALLT